MARAYRRLESGLRLLRNVVRTRLGRPRPIVALWEMTYRCNMGCCFCNEKNLVTKEMDTEQALGMIEELAELETSIVLLTGGEPTLRKDFELVMDALASSKMASILCTNGSNVIRKFEAVKKADMIRISVDGYGELHDEIRAAPGAFKNIERCVPRLVDAGNPPMLVSVVTQKSSLDNLRLLLDQARSWNVQVDLSIVVYSMRTRMSSENVSLITDIQKNSRVGPEPFLALLETLEREYPDVVANPSFYKTLLRRGGLGTACRALDVSLNIKPDGSVSLPCDAFALQKLHGDKRAVWKEMRAMHEMKKKLGQYAFCKDCHKRCIAFPSMLLDFGHLADLLHAYSPTLASRRLRARFGS